MSDIKDYKDTLNLPQTGFPMKADLPKKEPGMIRQWEGKGIYKKVLDKNRANPGYVLHDGPPYANGHIHMGHALNKILKDIIVKYRSMKGFLSPYVPGWDCHGLPIELQVDKQLGDKKAATSVLEKRRLCRQYASGFVDIQREEFKGLGVFGLWERPYLTLTNDYEAAIVREFNSFVKGGFVYKGKKPVYWCPNDVTALAEAEVEYAEKESPSVFVRFKMLEEDAAKLGLTGDVWLVIWTTTPWTLPANLALAVNPQLQYSAVKCGVGIHILATENYGRIGDELGIKGETVHSFAGATLEGLRARHPFIDRMSRVITGDFVTSGDGTGIVHIAPGHGEDDYAAGRRNGLDVYAPVNDYGKFAGTGLDWLEGEFVFKANRKIIDVLTEKDALILEKKITHSYPHCWRCKKPIIFRATEQWFISIEHEALRQKCLDEIDKTQWVPQWGKNRIRGMMETRPDWCVSRQRSWGVPVTLLSCKNCGTAVTDPAVLGKTEALVAEHGSDIWFEKEADAFLPENFKCPKCGGAQFQKEKDILDVWFDSGVSHAAVLTGKDGLTWPADLYLEGSDQHRGWFHSSLICGAAVKGCAPYRAVLTHGFVVDGKGKKMSKSLGNVVAPGDIIKKHGAEILRLWVSAEDYKDDIRLSGEIVERLAEAYRKIRNTARFLLGNISDADQSAKGDIAYEEIDRWALSRLQGLIKDVDDSYRNFAFHEVYHRLYNFCVVDMSSFYLDILKDRLYTYKKDSPARRAAQAVLREILTAMARLMAPVLSFTAEEIWVHMPWEKEESVFLAGFPVPDEKLMDGVLEARWEKLRAIRDEVNKALEIKRKDRVIGNALEAKVTVSATDPESKKLLAQYAGFLPTLFIVSQAEAAEAISGQADVFESAELPGLKVAVARAEGEKCQRCWNYSTDVGTIEGAEGICGRCFKNLS